MNLEDIKKNIDRDYVHNQATREHSADDLVFAWVTQWDDGLLGGTQLQFRGEFNLLRKAMREILADLKSNPVQIDFQPIDEDRDDGADFLDGKYRATSRENTSIEALDNATQEVVVCGVGAWRLKNKYKSLRSGDKRQVITRQPIYEANNNLFWACNAKMLDKSDADRCTILWPYTEDGYRSFVAEVKGIDPDDVQIPGSVKEPQQSYTFPWVGQGENSFIYVAEYYALKTIKDKILVFTDMFGQESEYYETELNDDKFEALEAMGAAITDEKDVERDRVTLYFVSADDIIEEYEVPGSMIPVIPCYGERAFVEGEEHYEGITRLAKDPSRLRNFQLSYLADIVSRSPRRKPIFDPRAVAGNEIYFEESGADNNYPYACLNPEDDDGNPLPNGGYLGELPEPTVPPALAASITLTRQAIDDVAKSGAPSDISDPNLSGKAIVALQNKIELQSMVYQEHIKHAQRRDAEVYASMASEVMDTPRKEQIVLPDGTQKVVTVMEQSFNEKGELVTLNDIRNVEFEVYADIGPSYSSRKEETRERLSLMINSMDVNDPMRKILTLKLLQITDGVDFSDVRDYARKELVMMGIKKPETDEEKEMVAQAQQSQEPDAMMVAAEGQRMEGIAALKKEEREMAKTQSDIMVDQAGTQIDQFSAETARLNVQVNAEKAGADLQLKRIDQFSKAVGNRLRGGVA